MTGRGPAMATTKADVMEWVETQLARIAGLANGKDDGCRDGMSVLRQFNQHVRSRDGRRQIGREPVGANQGNSDTGHGFGKAQR